MPETEVKRSAPSMGRTKIQLATTYSPGTLFTFEGNLVVCESQPDSGYLSVNLPQYVRNQILKSIEEKVVSWYAAAIETANHTTSRMCVDDSLLNRDYDGLMDPFGRNVFGFVEPNKMGYQPTLLTMVCNACKLVRAFKNLKEFESNLGQLDASNCPDPKGPGNCEWRQTDIVFVHPNGTYCQPLPWRYDWDDQKSDIVRRELSCSRCGSFDVRLNERSSQIGKRFFYCASCGMRRGSQWLQNDRELLHQFRENSGSHLAEVRMRPVSYRANSVQYPQQDMVIDFGESKYLDVLSDASNRRLIELVGDRFEIRSADPSIDELEASVRSKLGDETWDAFSNKKKTIEAFEHQPPAVQESMKLAIDALRSQLDETMEQWRRNGIIPVVTLLAQSVFKNLQNRRDRFATKFDPFRLLVEHRALIDLVVNEGVLENGLRSYIPLDRLDEHVGPAAEDARRALNEKHREIMDNVGIETIGLVRKFKTIHFSFGFTRVGHSPRLQYINDIMVPVRLKLFPRVRIDDSRRRHPVFVLKQANEAIYVRLKKEDVERWLESIDAEGGLEGAALGLRYLDSVPEMNTFLDGLPGRDLDRPQLALAIYSLLHTYSHHVINAVSEYSGLSTGSLGEYLFPSDLSFLVFRRGMTMDLGNLTAMLRNNAPAFLNYIKNPRNLACGSGSLCLNRGGACPACLMIPEVNCLTQNRLLSRSILIGRGSPQQHGFKQPITGYFDTANERRS